MSLPPIQQQQQQRRRRRRRRGQYLHVDWESGHIPRFEAFCKLSIVREAAVSFSIPQCSSSAHSAAWSQNRQVSMYEAILLDMAGHVFFASERASHQNRLALLNKCEIWPGWVGPVRVFYWVGRVRLEQAAYLPVGSTKLNRTPPPSRMHIIFHSDPPELSSIIAPVSIENFTLKSF